MSVSSIRCMHLYLWVSFFLAFPLKAQEKEIQNQNLTVTPREKIDQLISAAQGILFTQPDSAFVKADQALHLSEQSEYLLGKANAHEIIGTVFFHQGVYYEALTHLQKAEALYKDTGDQSKLAENHSQKGLVYYNISQPDLAQRYHSEALKTFEELGDKKGLAYAYGNIGRLYEKKQMYSEAIDYQQKALKYYREINDKNGLATILENIGSIYEDKEQYAIAQDYFNRSLELAKETKDSLLIIIDLNNLGDAFRKTGAFQAAIPYTTQSLNLALRLNNRYHISSGYKDLSKIYAGLHDYEKAYINLELGRTMYEEMYKTEMAQQLSLMQTLFQTERKNSEIQLLQNNEKLNNWIKVTLIVGLLVVVLLGSLIINRQRLKLFKNLQVIDQNRQVFEAKTKLINKELENIQLHEQQLQLELDTRAKSLTAHTLHIIGKNKILEDIREKLNVTIKEEPQTQKKSLKNILKMIDQNFVQDKDWSDFRMIFEQVHQDFFDKLQNLHQDLTPADLRLAALIKLNLPSKDIATTLGISQDSLRIARYRLRKKLGLEQGESMTNFILSL